ncbi:MAG: transporter related [Herbinix sp.]|jgi:ATP-binding cassette subfamily B protein/ATP-binding cassette subfamily C protein|nr:transporter related [Herbinix sp.]
MNEKIDYPLGSTLRRMLKNVSSQNKKIYIYFILFTITATIYPFFSVLLPKLLISELSLGTYARMNYILYIITGYFVIAAIFGFVKTYTKDYAYPYITMLRIDYLRDMFDKLISLDYKYSEDAAFTEEHLRAMSATNNNGSGLEGVYHRLFQCVSEFLTILVFVLLIGRLNSFILLGLFVNIVATLWISKKVHQFTYSKKEALAHGERRKNYYYNVTHDFGYGKDIRIYRFKDRILSNYSKEIDGYINVHKQIKNREYLIGFLGLLTLGISDLLTYGVLIYKTVHGMSIADFSMYLAATISLSALLKTFIDDISFIRNEGQYVYDFYTFMDTDFGEKGGDLEAIKDDTLEIEFCNVSFRYPRTENYIFKNLNFKVHKGERLAIVGINGAGKSTLVKLMMGLYEVTEGEILINGIPIQQFDKKALFSMFSVVFQDVNILAFTLRENVACQSDDIDDSMVLTSLNKVGLGNKIQNLKSGLNQMMLKVIDENGTEFSGGENQKLSIARALYKNGSMVIMDEPTAALDALAEAEIYENFSELVKGKTAVYISHRLASTKFCDKIALFDRDGLAEYGNHDELMQKQGKYYEMFTIQGKYYTEGGIVHEEL